MLELLKPFLLSATASNFDNFFHSSDHHSTQGKESDRLNRYFLMLSLQAAMKEVHVVLADDDADDREMFEEVVKEIYPKLKFQGAENGEQLMQLLFAAGQNLPNLIFLDLNMPVKNGLNCLDEIRSHEELKNIPVIIYSTSSNIKDIEETFNRGANLYISKPNTYNDLRVLAKKIFLMNPKDYIPKAPRVKYVLSAK